MATKNLKAMRSVAKSPKPLPKGKKILARKVLLNMREEILSQVLESPLPESLLSTDEIGDEADWASQETSREVLLLLTARNKEKILAVEEALEKIRRGVYGKCEECGEKIEPARLKAMPLARLCVQCQSERERENRLQRRMEEESLRFDARASEEDI